MTTSEADGRVKRSVLFVPCCRSLFLSFLSYITHAITNDLADDGRLLLLRRAASFDLTCFQRCFPQIHIER